MDKGLFVPICIVNGVVENKPENNWTKYDKENVQRSLKAKFIITTALNLDEFLRVFHSKTAKEMWVILQVTREGTGEVKRARLGILTNEYELFRMKPEYNINHMQT